MSTDHHATILAACDGHDRGRQGVVLARALADATGARLLVATVYPHPALPFPPVLGHRTDEHRQADQAVRVVRDELAPGARAMAVPGMSPAQAICRLASEHDAALVVVGSRHQHARIGDSDHALQVLRSAHTDVLVVPDERPQQVPLRRIVVGFDAGDGARDALERAVELARVSGAELRVLAALSRDSWGTWLAWEAPIDAEVLDSWLEGRRTELTEAAHDALAQAGDVAATIETVEGDPVRALVAAAADADLLALGSRRWPRLARLALGSVSEPVVRSSACATLVVARRRTGDDTHDVAAAETPARG